MKQTSLYAYKELKHTGLLGKRQMQVYECFKQYGNMTNLEVSKRLNLPINCVTGRTNELVNKYGYIEEKGTRKQSTGKLAIIWGVINNQGYQKVYEDHKEIGRKKTYK